MVEVATGLRPKPKTAAGPKPRAAAAAINLELAPVLALSPSADESTDSGADSRGSRSPAEGAPQLKKGQTLELQAWMTTAKISTCKESTRADLLQLLDASGLSGSYDFVYLPMNYKTRKNYGFAVVDFVDAAALRRAHGLLGGRRLADGTDVAFCGFYCQGLLSLIEKYGANTVVNEADDDIKPLVFEEGQWRVLVPRGLASVAACRQPVTRGGRRQRARCARRWPMLEQ